jgi:hypothetical protein
VYAHTRTHSHIYTHFEKNATLDIMEGNEISKLNFSIGDIWKHWPRALFLVVALFAFTYGVLNPRFFFLSILFAFWFGFVL